ERTHEDADDIDERPILEAFDIARPQRRSAPPAEAALQEMGRSVVFGIATQPGEALLAYRQPQAEQVAEGPLAHSAVAIMGPGEARGLGTCIPAERDIGRIAYCAALAAAAKRKNLAAHGSSFRILPFAGARGVAR